MNEIESLMNFKPFRLDWTREDIRKQIFYKSGHHVGHIKVYPDGSFDKTSDAYKVIKYLIDNVYCPHVKRISWGDIKNSKLLNLENFSLNYQCNAYLKNVPDYYTLGINMNKKNTKTEELVTNSDENGSNFYHGCKGHWLLHDIKENGLNQPIQGVLTRSQEGNYYMHVHPGSVRQGVFGMTDDESNTLIVWDAYDAFDWIEPLEVDDWIQTFAEPQFDGKRPTQIHVNYNYASIELQCSGEYDSEGKETGEKAWRNDVSKFSKKVSKLFNGKPLNIYIGYDSRHDGIEDVQIQSLKDTCSRYVKKESLRFEPEIKLLDVSKIAEYNREYANQSTEFTYSRFLIPYLENYEGFSIFVDNDFVWTKPWYEMFYFLHPDNAVACVQYEYELEKMSKVKMGGEENVMYPKKLWSSFMIFNNAHEDCKKLTPEVVNTQTGKYLHQFEWTDKIDRIPDKYVFTEGMSDDDKRFNAVHYTRGGPWIKDMDISEIQKLDVYAKYASQLQNKLNK